MSVLLSKYYCFRIFKRYHDIKISRIQLRLILGPHDSSYLVWYYSRTAHDFKSRDDIIEQHLYQNILTSHFWQLAIIFLRTSKIFLIKQSNLRGSKFNLLTSPINKVTFFDGEDREKRLDHKRKEASQREKDFTRNPHNVQENTQNTVYLFFTILKV